MTSTVNGNSDATGREPSNAVNEDNGASGDIVGDNVASDDNARMVRRAGIIVKSVNKNRVLAEAGVPVEPSSPADVLIAVMIAGVRVIQKSGLVGVDADAVRELDDVLRMATDDGVTPRALRERLLGASGGDAVNGNSDGIMSDRLWRGQDPRVELPVMDRCDEDHDKDSAGAGSLPGTASSVSSHISNASIVISVPDATSHDDATSTLISDDSNAAHNDSSASANAHPNDATSTIADNAPTLGEKHSSSPVKQASAAVLSSWEPVFCTATIKLGKPVTAPCVIVDGGLLLRAGSDALSPGLGGGTHILVSISVIRLSIDGDGLVDEVFATSRANPGVSSALKDALKRGIIDEMPDWRYSMVEWSWGLQSHHPSLSAFLRSCGASVLTDPDGHEIDPGTLMDLDQVGGDVDEGTAIIEKISSEDKR